MFDHRRHEPGDLLVVDDDPALSQIDRYHGPFAFPEVLGRLRGWLVRRPAPAHDELPVHAHLVVSGDVAVKWQRHVRVGGHEARRPHARSPELEGEHRIEPRDHQVVAYGVRALQHDLHLLAALRMLPMPFIPPAELEPLPMSCIPFMPALPFMKRKCSMSAAVA